MPTFLIGLLCAAVSGGVTWLLTESAGWTSLAAVVVALLVWFGGGLALVVFDD